VTAEPGAGSARVLIVEDDDAHAALLARFFEAHEPRTSLSRVCSLQAARERLAREIPDLVIADLRLPDGAGSDLLESGGDGPRVPLVVMTSFGDEQVAVEAMRRGALDYVVKSEATLAEMPRIAERALREWRHIAERRRAEQALRGSEAHFRSLIENGLDLIALIGEQASLSYVSPSVERLLGWPAETLVGRGFLSLVHPEEADLAQGLLREARSGEGVRPRALLRLRSRSGEWSSFETTARLRPGGRGSGEVVLNAWDVTERLRAERAHQELEAQLRQAQKLETLGTLAGGIAHDFNNILQAIVGCTELALQRLTSDSPARHYLERSLEVARRARDLVRQIVQFARQGDQRRERVELDTLAAEVCRLLRAALPATVTVRERLQATGAVLGDASQLHQVLMNLATNALQALGEAGGTLEIALERRDQSQAKDTGPLPEGSLLMLAVRDDGPGMSPEVRERIFEPFFTTRELGTGLGLSVAHGIVRSHGGAITCESEPGRGTTFRVYLPEAEPLCERPVVALPARCRLLFVDDDENVVYVGKSVLESLGHEVTTARDGLEALELFQRSPGSFDAAVVDELMPRLPGSQLADELRRLRPRLPIVIASGNGLASPRRQAGGFVQLAKPFGARELTEALGAAFAESGEPALPARG